MLPDKSLHIHVYICVLLFPKEINPRNHTLYLLRTFEIFPKCQPHLTKTTGHKDNSVPRNTVIISS